VFQLKKVQERFTGIDDELTSMRAGKDNSEKLMGQMRQHNQQEVKKGEQVRKDLIAQNSILHAQVEKVIKYIWVLLKYDFIKEI